MATTHVRNLIKVEAGVNSNKFWRAEFDDNGMALVTWGRVGAKGQSKTFDAHTANTRADKKIREGYVEREFADAPTGGSTSRISTDVAIEALTPSGMEGNTAIADVVRLLVKVNAHNIEQATGGKVTVVDGQVRTPLGLLTRCDITEARQVLEQMEAAATKDGEHYVVPTRLVEKYLTIVPHKVGSRAGWDKTFTETETTKDANGDIEKVNFFERQNSFLDALADSLDFSEKAQAADDADTKEEKARAKFAYTLKPVTDPKVLKKVKDEFRGTANSGHGHTVNNARIRAVYEVISPEADKVFDANAAKYGNVRRYYHGSRAANILSILSKGLMTPRAASSRGVRAAVAGAAFGHGIYTSASSTKSLNYSRGGVWSSGTDAVYFMFVADVVTGWQYRVGISQPSTSNYDSVLAGKVTDPTTGKVYNSIEALPGHSWIRNHESIVPGPDRIALRYLIEFTD